MSAKMNIPQLRFSEFSEEWEKESIGHCIELLSGFAFKGEEISDDIQGISLLRGINITEGYIRHSDEIDKYFRGNTDNLEKYILNTGDLVLGMDGSKVGKNVALVSEKDQGSLLIQRVARLRAKECSINFIFQHIHSIRFHKYVDIVNTSSGIPHISAQQIKDFKIYFPLKQEQEKIASFLSSADTKIEQLTSKVKLLKEYKKGVMQKIFSQEIRFHPKGISSQAQGTDDGSKYPEWVEKKFGDIYEFIQTNSFSRALLNYEKGTVKNIHYGDIHTKFKTSFDITKEEVPFINEDVNIDNIADKNYCKVGDLVVVDASEDYADIGKTIEVLYLSNEKLLAGLHTYVARAINNNMALGFSGYLMQIHKLRLQMMKMAQGISVLGISKRNLSKIIIDLPSKSEQTKIANFLSSIDSKMEQTQKQLDSTKEFKKALLQQMFV